ncbi:MAG: GGDEF domain-containing protein, partial [Vallitaleaceae bacterium]|nr:GGDEF domain-containing protein [Vallitaleaceae bacterium]
MTQKILADEAKHQEKYLLFENEYEVNREVTFTLRIIGAGIVPLIFLLKFLGFFLFTIEEGLIPLVTTGIILLIPSIFGAFSLYKKPWFKYIVVICVTLSIPNMYIEFDYMMLILWVMPILASCLYFNKRFNLMSLGFNIFVLGVTSYYRSSQRMMDGLITDRIGSLYKDFLVSFTTYTLLTIVMFLFISSITKKANRLLYEMIQFKHYEKISIVDALTGIYNYRYLLLTIEKNKAEYEKSGTPFSIIVFDADHFKYINDNYGHLVGDKALIQICNCLKEQ